MKNLKLKLLAGLIGLSSIGLAHADTATTTFQVTATVVNSCQVTATNMVFPSFSQGASTVNATATITPVCTVGAPYTISINEGLNSDGSVRKMKNGVDANELLTYSLKKNDGVTAIALTGSSFSATGDGETAYGGADQTITIKGAIDTSQKVKSGSYADTLTVTVSY